MAPIESPAVRYLFKQEDLVVDPELAYKSASCPEARKALNCLKLALLRSGVLLPRHVIIKRVEEAGKLGIAGLQVEAYVSDVRLKLKSNARVPSGL